MAEARRIQGYLSGFSVTAPAGDYRLAMMVACASGQIRSVRAWASSAGTSGNTIIDLLKNGSSMYTNQAHRPTLASNTSGTFVSYPPDDRGVVTGDVLELKVATTAGHGGVIATAALEEP